MKNTFLALTMTLVLAYGCTSTKPANPPPEGSAGTPQAARPGAQDLNDFFSGAGQDASMLVAMNKSKMDAVRKAIVLLVGGEDKERLYLDILQPRIYNTTNPNQFVDMNTFERLRRDKVGEDFVFEARMKLRIDVIRNALTANNIPIAGAPAAASTPSTTGPATTTPATPAPQAPRVTRPVRKSRISVGCTAPPVRPGSRSSRSHPSCRRTASTVRAGGRPLRLALVDTRG